MNSMSLEVRITTDFVFLKVVLYYCFLNCIILLLTLFSFVVQPLPLGGGESGNSLGLRFSSNSSPRKSYSRSSSRLSYEDTYDDSEFSGPFVVDDDDMTDLGSRYVDSPLLNFGSLLFYITYLSSLPDKITFFFCDRKPVLVIIIPC